MPAEGRASIVVMTGERTSLDLLGELSEAELSAVIGAAAWYAKYHERMIAELADDPSATAIVERDRYLALHRGLGKLGVRLRRPAGIRAA